MYTARQSPPPSRVPRRLGAFPFRSFLCEFVGFGSTKRVLPRQQSRLCC